MAIDQLLTNEFIFIKMQRNKILNWRQDLIVSIVSVLLTIIISILIIDETQTESLLHAIGFTLLVTLLALAISRGIWHYNLLKEEISCLREISKAKSIIDIVKNLDNESIPFEEFITNDVLKRVPNNGGGYILYKVGDEEYKSLISNVFSKAKVSTFHAILSNKYLPDWWFHDYTDDTRDHPFKANEKHQYLDNFHNL